MGVGDEEDDDSLGSPEFASGAGGQDILDKADETAEVRAKAEARRCQTAGARAASQGEGADDRINAHLFSFSGGYLA